MKNQEISTRKRVRTCIKTWLTAFNEGDQLTTENIVRHVHAYVSKRIDPGTIRRELRFMRDDGLIDYKHVGQKREKIIQIIK